MNWPGVLTLFVGYMAFFTLGRDFVGWCWNLIVREEYRSNWARLILFGLVMSVVFLGIGLWRAWRSPLPYLTALDQDS
jgi:hypothetical protein